LHNMRKKVTVAAITFFVELRCSWAPQQEEEGDGNSATLPSSLCCATKRNVSCGDALQNSSTNKQTK
jgi:hypothetical protein